MTKKQQIINFLNTLRFLHMKQILCAVVALLNSTQICLSHESTTLYSITIKLPSHCADEHIPAYYKGHKLNLHEGWTHVPECGHPSMFSLLITEDVEFSSKGNTVRYLKRIPDQKYVWYDITLTLCKKNDTDSYKHDKTEEDQSYTWDIEERNHDEVPERIPDHTIVLLTNPDFIKSVTSTPSVPGSPEIILPTIQFKEDIDKKEFEDTMLSIIVGAALNLNAIHTNKTTCTIKKENIIISLAQQPYESQ